MVEVVSPAPDKAQEVVDLLSFAHNPDTDKKKSADVKIVYKDTLDSTTPMASLTVTLAPGIVDRTYLLLHYSELDPDCVHGTPTSSALPSPTSLSVTISCPSVGLNFFTPKPDMREERDLVASLYTRAVHPEVAIIQLIDLVLKVSTEGGLSPLVVGITSSALELSYQESPATQPFCLVQGRRLQQARDRLTKTHALELTITVCMDDSLKLQGRYNSRQHRMEKSIWKKPSEGEARRGGSEGEENRSPEDDSYFVLEPGSGPQGHGGARPMFLQQQGDILAALRQAALKNNLLIDIRLDAVSLVVPGKRLYELIYNRLGNDMLLWVPQYLAVREQLFGERMPDPLHDDTSEFSSGFQGRPDALEGPRARSTTAFPKDRVEGALEIHTDTAVLLAVNQAQVLLCLPMEGEQLGLVHLSGVGLRLSSTSTLTSLVWRCSSPPTPTVNAPGLSPSPLITTSLATGKVLLDTATNLKSIQLAFQLAKVGLSVRDAALAPDWVTALADFFTVVEFPVLGYTPPAVLSELHFQLLQCAVELTPPSVAPATAVLCIGKASVSCALMATTKDASVSVALEDVALYLSKEADSHGEAAVGVADTDYLDLGITLSEPEGGEGEPTLLVTASANMVRLRTCADTLQLLAEIGAGLAQPEVQDSGEEDGEGEDATIAGQTEDMLPDLEDAMVELNV